MFTLVQSLRTVMYYRTGETSHQPTLCENGILSLPIFRSLSVFIPRITKTKSVSGRLPIRWMFRRWTFDLLDVYLCSIPFQHSNSFFWYSVAMKWLHSFVYRYSLFSVSINLLSTIFQSDCRSSLCVPAVPSVRLMWVQSFPLKRAVAWNLLHSIAPHLQMML